MPHTHCHLYIYIHYYFAANIVCVDVCVLLEHVCILYTGGMCCGCWKQISARWQSSESLRWMMCVVELLGGHVA